MSKERALVRIMTILGFDNPKQARDYCNQVRRLATNMQNISNTEIANFIEANYQPGIKPKQITDILTKSRKPQSNNKPAEHQINTDKRFMRQITKVFGGDHHKAKSFSEQVQSLIKKQMPLAFIASAVTMLHSNGQNLSIEKVANLAKELQSQTIDKLQKQKEQSLAEKKVRWSKLQPVTGAPVPKHVIDEHGFIILNPAWTEKGDES